MRVKRILIIMLFIFLFVLSVLSGFIINSYINFSKKEEGNIAILADNRESNSTNETINTSATEIIVSPNAQVYMTENFKKCGHVTLKKEVVPREIVNLTENKVTKFYEGWNIDKFSAEEIEISKTSPGICNEHYILRESDGYISISCKNNIGEYIFKGLTDISTQYLPEEDLRNLEQGIEIVGKEALNKYLEDFE